jgi:hypothetical protein
MSVRGVSLYKVVIPEDSAMGTTIYDCDPVTGETKNAQDAIWLGPSAIGVVFVDSTDWTDADLGLKFAYKRSSTAADYVAMLNHNGEYDAGGSDACVIDGIATDAKGAYTFPAIWCMGGWVRLHSVNSTTKADVNQTGADKTLYVFLKS